MLLLIYGLGNMENFNDIRYLIIPKSDLPLVDFNEVREFNESDVNISPDQQLCTISYISGSRPSIYSDSYTELTYPEVLTYTTENGWIS